MLVTPRSTTCVVTSTSPLHVSLQTLFSTVFVHYLVSERQRPRQTQACKDGWLDADGVS